MVGFVSEGREVLKILVFYTQFCVRIHLSGGEGIELLLDFQRDI